MCMYTVSLIILATQESYTYAKLQYLELHRGSQHLYMAVAWVFNVDYMANWAEYDSATIVSLSEL